MERNGQSIVVLCVQVLGAGLIADIAAAQVLEEIVVTAQRREQNLQDVPVSVTVFDGSTVEKAVLRGAIDYLALTPNVSFTEDGQAGSRGLGIAIRGINNLVSGENAVINSVGIYLDEFSVASIPSQVANPFIPDMERIEILRGPQGTFFGRNALGGAINLTSKNPTDELGGRILIGGETYENAGEQFNLTGILNIPLSENFKVRGVVYYEDSTGRVRNICAAGASAGECPIAEANLFVLNGAPNSGNEYFMGRLKATWDIGDRTTAGLTLIYADEDQGHDDNVPSGILDLDTVNTFGVQVASDPGTGFWPDNRNLLNHDRPEQTSLKTRLAILNVRHQFSDNLVLKWITGVLDADLARLFDNDLVGGADVVFRDNFYQGNSWSSELRLEGSTSRLDWIAGVLYADDEQTQENLVSVGVGPALGHDLDPPNGVFVLPGFPEGLGLALNEKSYVVESAAVFADLTFHVSDRLDLIAGGRYTRDKVKDELVANGIRPSCCFPFSPGFPGPPTAAFFSSFVNFENPEAKGDLITTYPKPSVRRFSGMGGVLSAT